MQIMDEVEDSFAEQTFPATTEALIQECGETTFELPNGACTIEEVLSCLPEAEYESAQEALEAAYGAVGEEAIGRKGYSDRDPCCPGEVGAEPVSL